MRKSVAAPLGGLVRVFAHLLPVPLLGVGGDDASINFPFSPCATQHSDEISPPSPSSLQVFSPNISVSVSAFPFGCGRPWAAVGPLPAVQGVDSAAQFWSSRVGSQRLEDSRV